VTDHIQPLNSIGPVKGQENQQDEALNDPAKADYKAGRDFLSKGDYSQAANAFHNALIGFEEQGDKQGVANCADRLGDVCMAGEKHRMALEHFQRAFEICKEAEDAFSMLELNKKMAEAYKRLGELDKALGALFDLFDQYTDNRNPQGTVEVLEKIAGVYMDQGENLKAADALRTIASIHANFKHHRMAGEFEERALLLEQQE